jgi:hypothetical protein
MIGFGIGNRHRQAVRLQLPGAVIPWSRTRHGLSDSAQRVQLGGPFGRR